MRRAMYLAAAAACLALPAAAEFPRNTRAPSFTLKRIEGGQLSLPSLRGKVVLLDFWGPT